MPRRVRRDRRRLRLELTPRRALALVIGPTPGDDLEEDDETLAAVYVEHCDRLPEGPEGTLPWGFWAFEPHVPDDLRGGRPVLHLADEPAPDPSHLEQARRAWLQSDHHLGGAA